MCWLGYPVKHPGRYNPWPSLEKRDAVTDPVWTNVQSWDEEVRCPECVLWGFEIQLSGKFIKRRNQHRAALTQQGHGSDAMLRAISFYN
jgi:hypothetical protein